MNISLGILFIRREGFHVGRDSTVLHVMFMFTNHSALGNNRSRSTHDGACPSPEFIGCKVVKFNNDTSAETISCKLKMHAVNTLLIHHSGIDQQQLTLLYM